MSLGREILRTGIRTLAPPAMAIYIFYKMWINIKDKPGTKKIIEAYTKLWNWIKSKQKKPQQEQQDQTNWV